MQIQRRKIEIWSGERRTEKYVELKNRGTLEYYKLEFYYGTRVLET